MLDVNQCAGKRILVRIDFNVPVKNNEIVDDFRIKKTLPLIRNLLAKKASIVLLSHLTERKTHRSFKELIPALERACDTSIAFASDIAAACTLQTHDAPPVILLENLRAFPGEEQNDLAFAQELTALGDYYINEDFSQSHRPYASFVSLPKLLPSFVGPLFQQEVEKLSEALNPPHPFLLILGGVKFETKLGVLNHFLPIADRIFIGGALPLNVPNLAWDKSNVMLPDDTIIYDHRVVDSGPRTLDALEKEIARAAMVLWNGPLGSIEEGFDEGTNRLARALAVASESRPRQAVSPTKVIVGGGDTVSVLHRLGFIDSFYHVSTGGGAMLTFLATGTLPGIDTLLEKE